MTSSIKKHQLDYAATPQHLEKMAVGKVIMGLATAHDRAVVAAHIVGDNTNVVTASGTDGWGAG